MKRATYKLRRASAFGLIDRSTDNRSASNSKLCRSGASAGSGTRLINALHRASVFRTAVGTFETCRPVLRMSVHRGRTEVIGQRPKRRL